MHCKPYRTELHLGVLKNMLCSFSGTPGLPGRPAKYAAVCSAKVSQHPLVHPPTLLKAVWSPMLQGLTRHCTCPEAKHVLVSVITSQTRADEIGISHEAASVRQVRHVRLQ